MSQRGFHVGECYLCNQGNVYICKSVNNGTGFLACEECDSEWASPLMFKSRLVTNSQEGGRYIRLSKEEMLQHPWRTDIENRLDLEQ